MCKLLNEYTSVCSLGFSFTSNDLTNFDKFCEALSCNLNIQDLQISFLPGYKQTLISNKGLIDAVKQSALERIMLIYNHPDLFYEIEPFDLYVNELVPVVREKQKNKREFIKTQLVANSEHVMLCIGDIICDYLNLDLKNIVVGKYVD